MSEATTVRNVESLEFNPDALDIPSAMKLLAMVSADEIGQADIPAFMEIVDQMTVGGLKGVPFSQITRLVVRVTSVLGNVMNPTLDGPKESASATP